MSTAESLFSEKSQKAILWWGIALAVVYGFALVFLLQMVPPPSARWAAADIAQWYAEHSLRIRWGAVIASWTGAFMMPILAVVALQIGRVEGRGAKIWSGLSLVSGALMSLFLALPPIFFGVASYTPGRSADATAIMHELGVLTLVTTDQYYIFIWVAVTVISLWPATQKVENNPFPRWWGYTSLWITVMFEAGAFAFVPRSGPLAWDGLLVFWSPVSLFTVWIVIQSWLLFRALNRQIAAKRTAPVSQFA